MSESRELGSHFAAFRDLRLGRLRRDRGRLAVQRVARLAAGLLRAQLQALGVVIGWFAARGSESVAALAAGAGHAVRHARTVSAFLPGLAGAGMASWGTALIYRPAGIILGGLFLLAMDRQINVDRR